MRFVSPLDATWLYVEARDAPMHVGCLQIFEPPEGAPEDFLHETLAELRQCKGLRLPFSLKLAQGPFTVALKAWVEEPHPDMSYHVAHIVLPKPAHERHLTRLISQLQGAELALDRPLWRCYVIEGLPRGRFALFTKMHHSLIDGIGGVHLLQSALSADPAERGMPAPWARRSTSGATDHAHDHEALHGGLRHAIDLATEQLRSVPGLVRAFSTFWKIARHRLSSVLAVPYRAPHTIFNNHCSPQRAYATQRLSLKAVQKLARRLEVTVNDVFLAVCAGALRRYLREADALPQDPLIAGVPVSVRPAGDDHFGTAVTFILASLQTDREDPLERLRSIHDAMVAAKHHLQGLRRAALTDYTLLLMGPYILEVLTGFGGYGHPVFNLAISNVPGPAHPLYFNGARMEAMYPTSVLTHGQALNITVLSYDGHMNIGYTACAKAMPQVGKLADYTREAFAELKARVGGGSV